MPLHHPALLGAPEALRAARFFEEVCPRVLAARHQTCAAFPGVYTFQLTGEGGGTWSLVFETAEVVRGSAGLPLLLISGTAAAFERWLAGKPETLDWIGSSGALTALKAVLAP